MPQFVESRSAGVLLPIFSLPGGEGIGDLGTAAHDFLDWLAEAGFRYWQILPAGPTQADGSPYAALAGAAGNPLWISGRRLVDLGWLAATELSSQTTVPNRSRSRVDYPTVFSGKEQWLRLASKHFEGRATHTQRERFREFLEREGERWLDDWCLFASVRRMQQDRGWHEWPRRFRTPAEESGFSIDRELALEIRHHAFVQFVFFLQWEELAAAAAVRGIEFVGDLPFYPALNSVDVWRNRNLFRLDESGSPDAVAGVPPDYFSEDGQLWGNPVYRWDSHADALVDFWEARLRSSLRMTATVRLDHFRAFVDYWEVPAGDSTARNGRWVPGPGIEFFRELERRLGSLPLIAEDLGDITEAVDRLRLDLGLAGMKIFQFGFGDDESARRHTDPNPHSIHYTGTHDNDTLAGWFASLEPPTRSEVLRRLGCAETDVVQAAIEAVFQGASQLAIIPLQDLLGYGSEARVNLPGTTENNWCWRAYVGATTLELAAELRARLQTAGRFRPASTRGKATSAPEVLK